MQIGLACNGGRLIMAMIHSWAATVVRENEGGSGSCWEDKDEDGDLSDSEGGCCGSHWRCSGGVWVKAMV